MQLSADDVFLEHLVTLLIDQVSSPVVDAEPQKGHGVAVRVEEDVGMWTTGKKKRLKKKRNSCDIHKGFSQSASQTKHLVKKNVFILIK
jgi:hypothetical protein